MTVTRGYVETFDEAITLAFREAQVQGMKPEVAHLFGSMLERAAWQAEVQKLVNNAVKGHYGKEAKWDIEEWWPVPVATPRYEARGLPSLAFETRVYLVASVQVSISNGWDRNRRYITVIEAPAKPQTTLLPLCLLQALLDGNEHRYRVVGKDGSWTSLEIVGLKQPVRLHEGFKDNLREVFRHKPVADWVDDFGMHGRSLAPTIVGALLGMRYRQVSASLPTEQQPCSREALVAVMTSLGYGTARAQRAVERAEPELRAGMTLAEATPIVLRHITEEE
jgi:hypothetical protein